MMRVLTLCYEFPPLGGGGGRVVYGLSRELVRLGHEVTVVTMGCGGLPRRETVDGIEVQRVPGIRRRPYQCSIPEVACHLPVAARVASRLQRERRFDLAHAHFIFPDGFTAWRLFREAHLPYVITAHGSDVPGYDPHRLRVAHSLLAPLWRRIVGAADAVVCPSSTLAELVGSRAPQARIETVRNGIAAGDLDPLRPRRNQVLVVSKMLERKGIQYLIRAVAGTDLGFEVDIVGDGPYMPEIRRAVAESGAAVRLWGWLDNQSEELAKLFETSSIFVMPSESENFPIVLLEAMRAGLAIVTTRGTGCAEVVGDAALLIEPRNAEAIRSALMRLAAEPALRTSLGRAARARLESNFGWAAVTRRYVELYHRCGEHGDATGRAARQAASRGSAVG
jgi:glycosyltransferase involved in cell wall biosynthesis